MHLLSTILAALVAAGFIAIGARYIVNPATMTPSFGLPMPETGIATSWWLRLKGVRDVASGLAVLALLAWGRKPDVGIMLLAAASIPLGDMLLIFAAKGSAGRALGVHGSTVVLVTVCGLLMLLGR